MDLKSLDKLEQSKELVNGLYDIMIFMENAKQDVSIPVGVLYPFREVVSKVSSLLEEIEEREKKDSGNGEE